MRLSSLVGVLEHLLQHMHSHVAIFECMLLRHVTMYMCACVRAWLPLCVTKSRAGRYGCMQWIWCSDRRSTVSCPCSMYIPMVLSSALTLSPSSAAFMIARNSPRRAKLKTRIHTNTHILKCINVFPSAPSQRHSRNKLRTQ